MRTVAAGFIALALVLFAPGAGAKVEVLSFDTPDREQRYNTLIKELRCLVCQNQNLADSNAELAKDLREKTYEMIQAGVSDDEIVDYMINRYGDFVLYRPPVKTSTVFLWLGPFIALLIGLFVVTRMIRRGSAVDAEVLDQQQQEQVKRLLRED